jgi:hypothetical protein
MRLLSIGEAADQLGVAVGTTVYPAKTVCVRRFAHVETNGVESLAFECS